MMREAGMDALATLWANARAAHLLAVQRMTPVEVGNGQEERYDTDEDNPLMYTQKAETLEPFSSHVIPVKTVKAYSEEYINIIVQALHTQDGTLLPRPYCAEYIHQTEEGWQESSCGGVEQYCLPSNPSKEDPCG